MIYYIFLGTLILVAIVLYLIVKLVPKEANKQSENNIQWRSEDELNIDEKIRREAALGSYRIGKSIYFSSKYFELRKQKINEEK